jgi:hypothetical protein
VVVVIDATLSDKTPTLTLYIHDDGFHFFASQSNTWIGNPDHSVAINTHCS